MTLYRDTDAPIATEPPHGDYYHDVVVIERAKLARCDAANFKNPWLVQYHTGRILGFPNEESACRHQRIHRARNGRHPMTGEKL